MARLDGIPGSEWPPRCSTPWLRCGLRPSTSRRTEDRRVSRATPPSRRSRSTRTSPAPSSPSTVTSSGAPRSRHRLRHIVILRMAARRRGGLRLGRALVPGSRRRAHRRGDRRHRLARRRATRRATWRTPWSRQSIELIDDGVVATATWQVPGQRPHPTAARRRRVHGRLLQHRSRRSRGRSSSRWIPTARTSCRRGSVREAGAVRLPRARHRRRRRRAARRARRLRQGPRRRPEPRPDARPAPGHVRPPRRPRAGSTSLRTIERRNGSLCIGAGTTQADHRGDPTEWPTAVPLLARATPLIGHFQIRNRGTIGGSLAHADPAAEYPAVALALDAELVAQSPSGRRTIPAADFFHGTWSTDAGRRRAPGRRRLPRVGGPRVATRSRSWRAATATSPWPERSWPCRSTSRTASTRCGIGLLGLGLHARTGADAEATVVGVAATDVDAASSGRRRWPRWHRCRPTSTPRRTTAAASGRPWSSGLGRRPLRRPLRWLRPRSSCRSTERRAARGSSRGSRWPTSSASGATSPGPTSGASTGCAARARCCSTATRCGPASCSRSRPTAPRSPRSRA